MSVEKKEEVISKKKEALSKVDQILESFQSLKNELTDIVELGDDLKELSQEDKVLILEYIAKTKADENNANSGEKGRERIMKLLSMLDQLKERSKGKTNRQVHVLHTKINKVLQYNIGELIQKTKETTLDVLGGEVSDIINKIAKYLKTGISAEILTQSSDNDYIPIPKDRSIQIDDIRQTLSGQIDDFEEKIEKIIEVKEFLHAVSDDIDDATLIKLIEGILKGEELESVEVMLQKCKVQVEVIELQETGGLQNVVRTQKPPTPKVEQEIIEEPKTIAKKETIMQRVLLGPKVLFKRATTPMHVNWSHARKLVQEEKTKKTA